MILSQALCSLFCLASLTQHKAFEIHPCCCTYQKFVLLRHILLFDRPTLCLSIYLLVDIRLFPVLEQKTAVNICVPILCVHVLSFLLGKHPTKMAGSYSKNVVDFIRTCQLMFQRSCAILYSPAMSESSNCFTISPTLSITSLSNLILYRWWCESSVSWWFNIHFPKG